MSFEEDFLYPLYLLIIGGGMTGILIPFFNKLHESKLKKIEIQREEAQKRIERAREDHRRELEIKSEIIKNISSVYSHACIAIFELSDKKSIVGNEIKTTVEGESFRKFFSEREITTSLIEAYFRGSKLVNEWKEYVHSITQLWVIYDFAAINREPSEHDMADIKEYFGKLVTIDWDKFEKGEDMVSAYNQFNTVLYDLKSKIIQKILHEEINTGKKI